MSKIIAVMLALAIAALANVASAVTWEHFNADPAYPSSEAAIADAPRVMRQAGYPEPVISLLTEAMKKPGVRTHVTNGMKLDFMRSGKSALWRNVEVKFKKPPREASMEYSAPAEEWTVDWNGTTWTFGRPDVCNNSYGKRASAPTPPAPVPTVSLLTVTNKCPNGRTLTANAWSLKALPEELRNKAEGHIAAANNRAAGPEAYKADAVSRSLGGQLRREVKVRAPVTADIQVVFRDPKTSAVVQDRSILRLADGVGSMTLSGDQLGLIVETIWPNEFVSPTVSGDAHRLWFFPEEWKNYCTMNIHGLVP